MSVSSQKRKELDAILIDKPAKREKGIEDEITEKISNDRIEEVELRSEDAKDFFGLPFTIQESLEKLRNVKSLYEWQSELLTQLTSSNKNLVYSVPTSGGKTLVSEIMILKEILQNQKDALLILPYISIVQEKIRHMTPFALKHNFLIEEYAGPKGTVPPKMRRKFKSLFVATIEKAHLLISCLIQANKLDRIGLVVVDELHMVGDGTHRATVLEGLMIKLKLATIKHGLNIRMLGMSATLSNLKDISDFLDADIFEKNFRPVQLKEFVKFGSYLYEFFAATGEFKYRREFNEDVSDDPQHLRIMVQEVVPDKSCLVFCATKKRCELITRMLCKHLPDLKKHRVEEKIQLIKDILEFNNGFICETLRRTIPYGIVYHHSGLTSEEREAIEGAFLAGVLCCIVCTSTLAAGVNLPAQRVIIRDPFIGRNLLSKSSYKQMSGRAGRAGLCNSAGESILVAHPDDIEKADAIKLLQTPVINCFSGLIESNGNGLATLILSLFDLQLVRTLDELKDVLLKHSLFGVQFGRESNFFSHIDTAKEKLIKLGLLTVLNEVYQVTAFGSAVVKGLIHIDRCQHVYNQINNSLLSFNLSTDLHLIFISTLLQTEDDFKMSGVVPDVSKCFDEYSLLNDEEHRAAVVLGIKPGDITRFRISGIVNEKLTRFYITLIVYAVKKNGQNLSEVARRFGLQRGTVQSLLTQVASNASSLYRFFAELKEFKKLQSVFEDFPKSLYYCCTPELVPLLELPAVKLARAKQLHLSGFKTISELAKVTAEELCSKIENLPRKQAKEIIAKAQSIILATADELEEEAKELSTIVAN